MCHPSDPDGPEFDAYQDGQCLVQLSARAFGQFAVADSGVLYGSGGYNSDGVLVTIDKDSGDATIINGTGIHRPHAIAISSNGEIIGISSNRNLYKIDADSANIEEIGALINELTVEFNKSTGRKLKLEIEPGTYLMATTGALISTIQGKAIITFC